MKAVMMSIQPKWCELIASGKKTVEVRKTRPKLETPFKCYVYETKAKDHYAVFHKNTIGKVTGEFVCDEITCYTNYSLDKQTGHTKRRENLLRCACMTLKEWRDYIGYYESYYGYAWHISDLVIYDEPKEFDEFSNYKKYDWWDYGHHKNKPQYELRKLSRPPQSWCYVEKVR